MGKSSKRKHYERWERIAQSVGIERVKRLVLDNVASAEEIREALKTDECLNNIPLHLWDRLHPFLKAGLAKAQPIPGTNQGWASLADAMCLSKHVAKYYIAGAEPPQEGEEQAA